MTEFTINPKEQNISIQIIIDRIENGFKLQSIEASSLTKEDLIKYNDAIIIAPDYQREYRATVKDESSLIESILVGIPIPPIFMANDKYKGVQVMNVVDGQHRLRAFYRYIKNLFALKELTLLKELVDKRFDNLDFELQRTIYSKEISVIVFKDFPGKEFELEIFNRYNKGTRPLTPQEIRHAVYDSDFNSYVNDFAKKLFNDELPKETIIYNATKDRIQKKKLQESVFVILSILEKGIDTKTQKSPQYAEKYMKEKSELQIADPDTFKENYSFVIRRFENFNNFILKLSEEIQFPFSKELYGLTNRNYKFQISIAMILAGIYNKICEEYKRLDNINENIDIFKFKNYISSVLENSFIEDSEYSASSTNPSELDRLIKSIDTNRFYTNND